MGSKVPYVGNEDRHTLDVWGAAHKPGQLNYQITRLLIRYLELHGNNYDTMNAIVGALECAKIEFLRRVVSFYEEKKCKENGDVYPGSLF